MPTPHVRRQGPWRAGPCSPQRGRGDATFMMMQTCTGTRVAGPRQCTSPMDAHGCLGLVGAPRQGRRAVGGVLVVVVVVVVVMVVVVVVMVMVRAPAPRVPMACPVSRA